MVRRINPRSALVAGILGVALFAGACSSNNDPATWADAEADGNLEENFLRSCVEANEPDSEFSGAQAEAYCGCAFTELVEYFGGEIDAQGQVSDVATAVGGRDFEAFKDQEKSLRDDPTDVPADIEAMFNGCAAATR